MRVDRIDNYINGWFIGDFSPALIQNKNFEIAYKKHKQSEYYEKHTHKETIEINFLIKGQMTIQNQTLSSGDIFIIYPYEISDPVFLEDCEIMVIRYPSIPKDKYLIKYV